MGVRSIKFLTVFEVYSDWGLQPVVTRLESRSGRIFVIVVCAYTVLQTVQRHGVYSAAYGTVHNKEPLKSFEIRVGHIVPASGFLLSRYCHDCAGSDVKQYSYIFEMYSIWFLPVQHFYITRINI